MQIIEKSIFGVRAARHTLTSSDGGSDAGTRVTLFPMVHVGTDAFYRDVYKDAGEHDVMLVEGVRSQVVKLLTSSYRWINTAKLGLKIQPRSPEDGSVKARIIHADLTAGEFQEQWEKVPLWMRGLVYVLAPIIGLKRRLFASRESIAKNLELEDRLSADEILSWDPQIAVFKRCILGVRDERLIARLSEEIERKPEDQERTIAVVYGAEHKRAVLAELKKRGFRTSSSAWLTVFAFD